MAFGPERSRDFRERVTTSWAASSRKPADFLLNFSPLFAGLVFLAFSCPLKSPLNQWNGEPTSSMCDRSWGCRIGGRPAPYKPAERVQRFCVWTSFSCWWNMGVQRKHRLGWTWVPNSLQYLQKSQVRRQQLSLICVDYRKNYTWGWAADRTITKY